MYEDQKVNQPENPTVANDCLAKKQTGEPEWMHEIDNQFVYHQPKGTQTQRYMHIRETAKKLAYVIMECCPKSADRTAAIRKLREAVMTANAAIACNE